MDGPELTPAPRRGLSNKELLIRVLDDLKVINSKLDAKADRAELNMGITAVQNEALSTKESVNQSVGELRKVVQGKVGRGELFGWLSFAAGLTSIIFGVLL
jgi:hypothetical protein